MNKFLLILVFLLLLLGASMGWVYHQYQGFLQQPLQVQADGQTITIKRGSSHAAMVEKLLTEKISKDRWPWRLLQRLEPQLIKAGEYQLEEGMTPQMWLQRLSKGEVIRYSFTIIEGWRAAELLLALKADDRLVQSLNSEAQAGLSTTLGIDGESIEGWFLPETYSFTKGDSDLSILRQSYHAMQVQLEKHWQEKAADLPLDNPYEMLILASIVEKETALASERSDVAGVFVRRLQKRMRLQTDPTVIYGLGDAFDGDIRWRDLRTDTPYNTYTRFGLPPTPIALPGAASLAAVGQPADGKTLYFVADGSGGHTFSETYAEHNKAVQRMLKRK
ncbi:MAG: endolytic transglycosylase MltG [Xanthomonadales bacterium]|nr:endolytic transglycosylase MltG [Xanthomonadales bacterium]